MLDAIAYYAQISRIILFDTLGGLVLPAIFFVLLALALRGRRIRDDYQRVLPETGLNIRLILFNTVLVLPAIVLTTGLATRFLQEKGVYLVNPSVWDGLPQWLVIFAGITIGDFVGYWRHRIEHSRLLWPAHAVHHSDTEMTWLTLERFHPINLASTVLIDSAALVLLGLPPFATAANNLVRHYYGFFIHADLPWTYGPFGKIFVSPSMHRWHHAADVKAFNTNYATVYALWDRAFGTFRVPGPCTVPLGVTDEMGQTLSGQLRYPFKRDGYRGLFGRPKKKPQAEVQPVLSTEPISGTAVGSASKG